MQKPNRLISESSPYLLQHAYNPVDWHPYSAEIFQRAKKEKKLVIISIGYAACHWCHVMEHESFEDKEAAEVMNRHFISVKVDREERPDLDQIYIHAVQLMTGSGGWPLNVVTLPDGRPIWGGTYFRKSQWISALEQIQELYRHEPEKLIAYANRLEHGMKSVDLISKNESEIDFHNYPLEEIVNTLSLSFDLKNGGFGQAPKFMMPNTLEFLLRYSYKTKNKSLEDFVMLTLQKMAFGGLYDQIDGGFSRYSVDEKWHIPHFEKMLYDNALLISLYSHGYQITKNHLFKNIIKETIAFVEKELMHPDGIYFSSLDADSLNNQNILEEGAFYYFSKKELQNTLKEDFKIFQTYYNITDFGEWENGKYVLIRTQTDEDIADKFDLDSETLSTKKKFWKTELSALKSKRPKPRLDDKSLTSWNAMMITALLDAFHALNDKKYFSSALKHAEFLMQKQQQKDGSLFHIYKDERSSVPGFLEDYAFVIEMNLKLYESTFDWKWIASAEKLMNYCLEHFFDSEDGLFYFTAEKSTEVIHRTKEYYDNVIPSSNSVMAKNLFKLSKFIGKTEYEDTALQMVKNLLDQMENHPRGFGNWLDLMMNFKYDFFEIVIAGEDALSLGKEINTTYLPEKILAATTKVDKKPIFQNRFQPEKNLFYVCKNNSCKQPFENIQQTLNNLI